MSGEKLYLYPKWLRIWHGINALSIIILIISGISMQYSSVENPLLSFELAVYLHNIFGVITAVNYLFFFIANLTTSNGRAYLLKMKGLVERLILQSKYYLFGYFKGEAKPFPISRDNKFNPLQRVAYVSAMYGFVPLVIITGLALLYPEIIIERVLGSSGIMLTAILHATMGFMISLFLIIHLYVASVGKNPFKNYKSIVSGYHED
ncbi:cytochrome b/b6 domain-containing protein [Roseimarinus sediminis]|jgi:thiosulfate reductase cytochrome b subunit|uniref:cytochrome b/b6 domain-containing protein n=1 Tax=Roseimarinus sediminis TaxID=1610899 RepID=UPI003D1ACC41